MSLSRRSRAQDGDILVLGPMLSCAEASLSFRDGALVLMFSSLLCSRHLPYFYISIAFLLSPYQI
jgi:hypothetical protein